MLQPDPKVIGEVVPNSAVALNTEKVYIKGYVYAGSETAGIQKFVLCRDAGTCCFGGNPKADRSNRGFAGQSKRYDLYEAAGARRRHVPIVAAANRRQGRLGSITTSTMRSCDEHFARSGLGFGVLACLVIAGLAVTLSAGGCGEKSSPAATRPIDETVATASTATTSPAATNGAQKSGGPATPAAAPRRLPIRNITFDTVKLNLRKGRAVSIATC